MDNGNGFAVVCRSCACNNRTASRKTGIMMSILNLFPLIFSPSCLCSPSIGFFSINFFLKKDQWNARQQDADADKGARARVQKAGMQHIGADGTE